MTGIGVGSDVEVPATVVHNPLDQFVQLAKGATGTACLDLIKQSLEAPGVHVFGELLDMPNIKEVRYIFNDFLLFICNRLRSWKTVRMPSTSTR